MNSSLMSNPTRSQALTTGVCALSGRVNQVVLTVSVAIISLITILRGTG
jgi:hypothetical protein